MKAKEKAQRTDVLSVLASLLAYPAEPLSRRDDLPEISAFFDEVAHVAPAGLEELYTRTFDLNPVATLEVGWHIWGEQYERGRFLAELRGKQENAGIDGGSELPDHLTVILKTIARTGDRDLIEKTRLALAKMLKPLDEHGNPYRHLLLAVDLSLKAVAA